MAEQEFLITLKVKVLDLPLEERIEDAEDQECRPSELPGAEDLKPHELAEMISFAATSSEDLFAGSMIWAKIEAVTIVSADISDLAETEGNDWPEGAEHCTDCGGRGYTL